MNSRVLILTLMAITLSCNGPAADTSIVAAEQREHIDELINEVKWLDPYDDATEIWNLFDELREVSQAAYCRGLKELAGVQRIRLSYREALDYYKRHLGECPSDSGVVMPLAEIVRQRPDLCGHWVKEVKKEPLPLSEHDPIDAFDVVLGQFLIQHKCEGLPASNTLLTELSRLRAAAAFGAHEPDMAAYVRNMVAGELALQDENNDKAFEHFEAALDVVCIDATLFAKVVNAFPQEAGLASHHLVHVDGGGLLFELLIRLGARDRLEADQLQCVERLEEQVRPMQEDLEKKLKMEAQSNEKEIRVITRD